MTPIQKFQRLVELLENLDIIDSRHDRCGCPPYCNTCIIRNVLEELNAV
jgi:hypothetical protein